MPAFDPDSLTAFGRALFLAAGAPAASATAVATSLVEADLRGLESHGVMRVPRYIGRIRDGTMRPDAAPVVSIRRGANAVVDGGWGFGQLAAQSGTRLAIEICSVHGQAGVAVSQAHHIGRLGEYAEMLAAAGLAGLVMAAGGNRGGSVAVHGSRQRLLGTNPLAMALPTPPRHAPLVLDFATSAIPEGRVVVAQANGTALPPGSLVDRDGRPSVDPADFSGGGALLPFGAHKGSALMLMIEILATTLAGSMPIALPGYTMGNPAFIVAWSVQNFTPLDAYLEIVGGLLDRIKASAPADGFSEVLLPGEIEARRRRERMESGVPFSDGVWNELTALAASLEVGVPSPRSI